MISTLHSICDEFNIQLVLLVFFYISFIIWFCVVRIFRHTVKLNMDISKLIICRWCVTANDFDFLLFCCKAQVFNLMDFICFIYVSREKRFCSFGLNVIVFFIIFATDSFGFNVMFHNNLHWKSANWPIALKNFAPHNQKLN